MNEPEGFLRVAVANKGGLHEPTLSLLRACSYKLSKSQRGALSYADHDNKVIFYFLRPNDIPMYVALGKIDCGITGKDFAAERGFPLESPGSVMDLGFARSRLCVAVPKDSPYRRHEDIKHLRIATSFPHIVTRAFGEQTTVIQLEGAVEISVSLGVADAIVDVVETGSTLVKAGLRLIGDALFHSVAVMIINPACVGREDVVRMQKRLRGRIVATESSLLEFVCPEARLEEALKVARGPDPMVSSLLAPRDDAPARFLVSVIIATKGSQAVVDSLAALGADSISLGPIENTRE